MDKLEHNFCVHCGHQNPARNNFCARCGQRMYEAAPAGSSKEDIVECPRCNHPNARSSKFCAACSGPLDDDFQIIDAEDFIMVKINLEQIDFENHKNLSALTKKIKDEYIIFDMGRVKWIDSTGIGALVTLTNRFTRTQQQLKFIGITPKVNEALQALQVDNIIDIAGTLNEAITTWGFPPR